jgi:hypothetical protein
MIIANPIYDVVFKRLMENERVAKFFISTLLNQDVVSVEFKPQEFTYVSELVGVRVFRVDFIAIIRTDDGTTKKILVEIQKAKKHIDLMRFRNYLAEQYKKEDKVNNQNIILPITTIYILGFNLPKINTACIHVERQYKDLINEAILTEKSDFVEKLTHDSYVVQIERITSRYKSRLDKLLSIFEQSNFLDEHELIKEYHHATDDDEEIKLMADILHHSGTDPQTRKQIEIEREAWRTIDAMLNEERDSYQKALEEKDKAFNEQSKTLEEKDKIIEELMRKLNGK